MNSQLLRFSGAVKRDPSIDRWMAGQKGQSGALARRWFEEMRASGDEVLELFHDGCPVACLGENPFGYVNIFTVHVNVGFFYGAHLKDPTRLLGGTGKRMRHVKLVPGTIVDAASLSGLIRQAYTDIKACVEHG